MRQAELFSSVLIKSNLIQHSFQSFHYWINIIIWDVRTDQYAEKAEELQAPPQPPPNLSNIPHTTPPHIWDQMRSRFVHFSTSSLQAKTRADGWEEGIRLPWEADPTKRHHSIPSYWFLCIIHTGPLKYKWSCVAESLKDWSPINSSALSRRVWSGFFLKNREYESPWRTVLEVIVGPEVNRDQREQQGKLHWLVTHFKMWIRKSSPKHSECVTAAYKSKWVMESQNRKNIE